MLARPKHYGSRFSLFQALAIWLLFCCGCLFTSSQLLADEPFRDWKDTSGKFSTKAQFVRATDNNVVLRKSDGIEIEVPFSRLCATDLEYVSQRTKRPLSSLIPSSKNTSKPNNNSTTSLNANIAPEVMLDSELKITLSKMKRREYAEAIEDFKRLIRNHPKSRVLRLQLAECLRLDHAPAQGIDVVTKVLEEDPKDQVALEIRATLYLNMTRELEAKSDLEKLLQLGSRNPQTFHQLAFLLAASSQDELRDGPRALELAKQACKASDYKNPVYLKTLAIAYAEVGEFEQARMWGSEAYFIVQQQASAELGEFESALNRFIDEQPFRIQRVSRLTDTTALANEDYQRKLYQVLRTIDLELANRSATRREAAFKSLMILAKSKRPEVISRIGNCNINGIGTPKNPDQAKHWFQLGHELGAPDSTFGLALCLLTAGSEEESQKGIQLLKVAADQKHAGACAQLAYQYTQGRLLESDISKSIPLLQVSALKRNLWGMATLGEFLVNGKGISQDLVAGKRWITLAAQQGDLSGMLLCGHYHLFGNHSDSNTAEGLDWLEKCSAQGHSEAKRLLGLHYYSAKESNRNIDKGLKLLEESSENGNFNAQLALSEIYLFGDEAIRSPTKALTYIQEGVKNKNPASIYLYSVCYLGGHGVTVDVEKGMELLQESSELGEPRARDLLARVEQAQIELAQREQAQREEAERELAQQAQLAAEEARRTAEAEQLAEAERARASNMAAGDGLAFQNSDDQQFAEAAAVGILAIGAMMLFNGFSEESEDYGREDDYQRFEEHRRHQGSYWANRARIEASYGNSDEAARSAAMAESYGNYGY